MWQVVIYRNRGMFYVAIVREGNKEVVGGFHRPEQATEYKLHIESEIALGNL